MTILPPGKDKSQWMMTSLDQEVLIIKHPGEHREEVVFRWNGFNREEVISSLREIVATELLTEDQKNWCLFWSGYFYCSLVNR